MHGPIFTDIPHCFDSFPPFLVPFRCGISHIIFDNFDPAMAPLLFHFIDLSISLARGNYTLKRMIANHTKLFSLKILVPISDSDHRPLLLKSMVYSCSAFYSLSLSKSQCDDVILLEETFFFKGLSLQTGGLFLYLQMTALIFSWI